MQQAQALLLFALFDLDSPACLAQTYRNKSFLQSRTLTLLFLMPGQAVIGVAINVDQDFMPTIHTLTSRAARPTRAAVHGQDDPR